MAEIKNPRLRRGLLNQIINQIINQKTTNPYYLLFFKSE